MPPISLSRWLLGHPAGKRLLHGCERYAECHFLVKTKIMVLYYPALDAT